MEQEITLEVKLPIKIEQRENYFVSSCPILDVVSQGETFEKAKYNIIEALSAFFIGCIELGTLDAVLKESGFRPAPETYVATKPLLEEEYVNVPIHLLAVQSEADNKQWLG